MPIKNPDGYVYRITNNINGKTYIGSHAGHNPRYMGSGVALKRAYKKYGLINFTKDIVIHCSDYQKAEQQILTVLNAANDKTMYNMTNTGTGFLKGHIMSEDTKAKIIKANTGKKRTPEQCAAISARQVGHMNPNYGKAQTAEANAKRSKALKGRVLAPEHTSLISKALTGVPKSEEHKAALRKPHSKRTCPHCGLVGGGGNMTRHHFDNCKHKPKFTIGGSNALTTIADKPRACQLQD